MQDNLPGQDETHRAACSMSATCESSLIDNVLDDDGRVTVETLITASESNAHHRKQFYRRCLECLGTKREVGQETSTCGLHEYKTDHGLL